MLVEIRDNFINAVSQGENDIRKHCLCLSPNQTAPFQSEKNVCELIKFFCPCEAYHFMELLRKTSTCSLPAISTNLCRQFILHENVSPVSGALCAAWSQVLFQWKKTNLYVICFPAPCSSTQDTARTRPVGCTTCTYMCHQPTDL